MNISGRGLTSFLSASDSPLFCVVGPPSLRCLSTIKYGRNNVQCQKKKTRSTSLGITFILYQMNRILWKLCWKKMFVRACRYTPYDNRIPKVNRYEKKKRKQATNVQFVSENIVRMIGHGSNFLRPRKKWPLLYNRPINMKTIRDSLSLFLSLFSSLVLFGLYDLLYGFRAIRQIKFCLFGTIIYSALHFFLGNPTIYLFADVFDRLHHLKQRRKRGKKNIPTT